MAATTGTRFEPVVLAGKTINLSQISKEYGLDQSYLSRVLSGQRRPRVDYMLKVAKALGMGLEELLSAIESRQSAA